MSDFDKSITFDKIDANNDSLISVEEFARWRKKLIDGQQSAVKAAKTTADKITWKQLRLLAVVSAVPMVLLCDWMKV